MILTILYLVLIAGFAVIFIGLFPKDPETVSVFAEDVKEKRGSFLAFSSAAGPF